VQGERLKAEPGDVGAKPQQPKGMPEEADQQGRPGRQLGWRLQRGSLLKHHPAAVDESREKGKKDDHPDPWIPMLLADSLCLLIGTSSSASVPPSPERLFKPYDGFRTYVTAAVVAGLDAGRIWLPNRRNGETAMASVMLPTGHTWP
jgi:hypothetical protein